MIKGLKDNQVFIFGSNLAGRHAGGAARQAHEDFRAEWGVGEGLTGKCYAFPTLDENHQKRSDEDLKESVKKLWLTVVANHDKEFLLTKVGCGIAGYSENYMRDLFKGFPKNLIKPENW